MSCGMGLIGAFEEHLQKQDLSAYTVNGYVRDLKKFFAWLREQTGRNIPPGEAQVVEQAGCVSLAAHGRCAAAACRNPGEGR